jgi:hypothetical protein
MHMKATALYRLRITCNNICIECFGITKKFDWERLIDSEAFQVLNDFEDVLDGHGSMHSFSNQAG